jgi:trans-AT polyketide synthase/acyltransferase/oxidoreductase domain-containing protein
LSGVKKHVIFMFSGQGSHYYQMGKDLYDSHPIFRSQMERGDAIMRQLLGRSVLAELYRQPISQPFDDLIIAHSALIMVEHALCEMLVSEGIEPDCVWGSSAGEFVAGIAAGIWSLESALAVSVEQASQVVRWCSPGGMLAILASPALYESSRVIREHTTFVGVNFSRHFVVSGSKANLGIVERFLSESGTVCQRLGVQYAFHSDAIDIARDPVVRFCHMLPEFKEPQLVCFFSGMTAEYLTSVPRSYFWDVVRQPIKFYEGVTRLEQQQTSIFVDCGPAGTSASFIKYSLPAHSQSTYFPLLTAFHQSTANLDILKKHLSDTRQTAAPSSERLTAESSR